MTYQEIKDLLTSGFTAEQITMLTTTGVTPSTPVIPEASAPITEDNKESPAEVGEEGATPSPTEGENTEQEQKPDPPEDIRTQLKALQDENKKLRETIQGNNIRDRTVPTVSEPDASATLAEIIRPTFNKGGK